MVLSLRKHIFQSIKQAKDAIIPKKSSCIQMSGNLKMEISKACASWYSHIGTNVTMP